MTKKLYRPKEFEEENPLIDTTGAGTLEEEKEEFAEAQAFAAEEKRKFETANQTINQRIEATGEVPAVLPPNAGINHTIVNENIPDYMPASNEKVIKNLNSFIVFGTDRPSSLVGGYGGKGATGASSIDIVVGRGSSMKDGDGAPAGDKLGPMFTADAARIYISQLTDIDINFGIEGTALKSRSGIGIKADGVRIIGREGVKIVTGKAFFGDEKNALGGTTMLAPPIELIAGNNVGTRGIKGNKFMPSTTINNLQPLLLGENTTDALLELGDIVDQIWSALHNLTVIQTTFNGILGITPLPHHAAGSIAATAATLTMVLNSLYQTRTNKTLWEVNHLMPYGYKYICSRNIKGT